MIKFRIIKRVFDIIISFFGILILLPIFIAIFILNLYYHGIPVFFSQIRPGQGEKLFKMFKFRSMTNNKDSNGNLLPDEKRLTRFGMFLRKTSIDEIPELFNVLIGNMSIVGPRPLLQNYLPYYTERERKRHTVKPGITGLSQVNGRNFINWDKRLELDVVYVEQMSFMLDIKILYKTFFEVINARNVSVDSSIVEPSLIDYRTKKI